jgi:RHS repeat-associated protein
MDEENATQMMLMQTVSYNHFNSVSELINVDNNLKVEFIYGADDQRRKADYFVGDIQEEWALEKTRYYIGAYEKQVDAANNEIEVHYISAGGMLVAMYVIENGIGQYYYPHQDHLGSIIHITDESAEIVYTQSFDAWGRTRNAEDLSYEDITESPNWLWRGYTGHEHLDEFGLINMNGRLYDPVIGRMLSPDNYVQAPGFSQSYNRYSYVWNNPLKYTDPSGELIWYVPVIIGAVVGGYIGGAVQQGNGGISGANWNPFGGNNGSWDNTAWQGITTGAIIGAGIGLGVSAGLAAGQANITGIATSGLNGFANTGATTSSWNIASNALITANINISSTALQGGGWNETAVSGLIGLGAGAIGGAVGSSSRFRDVSRSNSMNLSGIKAQNYATNILNGAGDRMARSLAADLSTGDVIKNTVFGGVEGLISAKIFSSDKMLNIGRGFNQRNNPVFSRYVSGFLSNSLTSNPGSSVMAARIYGAIYPTWMLGQMNGDLVTSISASLGFSPFLYVGLSAVQNRLLDSNYPYAYDFLDPNYWE